MSEPQKSLWNNTVFVVSIACSCLLLIGILVLGGLFLGYSYFTSVKVNTYNSPVRLEDMIVPTVKYEKKTNAIKPYESLKNISLKKSFDLEIFKENLDKKVPQIGNPLTLANSPVDQAYLYTLNFFYEDYGEGFVIQQVQRLEGMIEMDFLIDTEKYTYVFIEKSNDGNTAQVLVGEKESEGVIFQLTWQEEQWILVSIDEPSYEETGEEAGDDSNSSESGSMPSSDASDGADTTTALLSPVEVAYRYSMDELHAMYEGDLSVGSPRYFGSNRIEVSVKITGEPAEIFVFVEQKNTGDYAEIGLGLKDSEAFNIYYLRRNTAGDWFVENSQQVEF